MPTLKEAVETFCLIDRSPYTIRNYRHVLTRMVAALGTMHDLAAITDEQLLTYAQHLQQSGLKRSSLNQHILVMKTFFNWALKRRHLEVSPAAILAVRPSDEPPDKSRAMPAHVLAAMIEQMRYHPRNHALLLFMADSGCRVGGIASLTLDRLNLDDRSALLLEKGSRWHRAYFGETTAEALHLWLKVRPEVDTSAVFVSIRGGALDKSAITDLIRRLSRKVTRGEAAYGPHSIRHAVGHAMANAGVPVTITARKLGHDPAIAWKYYYPKHDEAVRDASDQHSLAALKPTRYHGEDAGKPANVVRFDRIRKTK